MFENMGASAPAFGMIGTLIGLILMLRNLDDPSTIGPGWPCFNNYLLRSDFS